MSKLCAKCQRVPAKPNDCYCADCRRTYSREWAQRNRGSKPRPIKPKVGPGEKFCPGCTRILSIERFSRDRGKSDGRMSHCKDCDGIKQIRWQQQNRDYVRQRSRDYQRRWRAQNPDYNRRRMHNRKRQKMARTLELARNGVGHD